jgi:hypothetical protein
MKSYMCSCRHLEPKRLGATLTCANVILDNISERKSMEIFVANTSKFIARLLS